MKTKVQALHEKAIQMAKIYLRAEGDLITILQQMDDCRGYRELGFKSLFEYATQGLQLSESVSYNFITIARKSKEVPRLQEMIQRQELTVSNARAIVPVLTPDNQAQWLSHAAHLSKRELEKEIAKEMPAAQIQERARYVSEELHEKLKRVQDLVSSSTGRAASLEETLDALASLYIDKKDPLQKALRVEKRTRLIQPVPGQVQNNPRFIPASIQHRVLLRDGGRCAQNLPSGARCQERRWLEIHHIVPVAQGGLSTLENLALICRGHHQMIHAAGLSQLKKQLG